MAFIICLSICMLGNFHGFCRLWIFFKIDFLSGTLSECQMVWIQMNGFYRVYLVMFMFFCRQQIFVKFFSFAGTSGTFCIHVKSLSFPLQ